MGFSICFPLIKLHHLVIAGKLFKFSESQSPQLYNRKNSSATVQGCSDTQTDEPM